MALLFIHDDLDINRDGSGVARWPLRQVVWRATHTVGRVLQTSLDKLRRRGMHVGKLLRRRRGRVKPLTRTNQPQVVVFLMSREMPQRLHVRRLATDDIGVCFLCRASLVNTRLSVEYFLKQFGNMKNLTENLRIASCVKIVSTRFSIH